MRGFSDLVKLLLYCHKDTKVNAGTAASVYWNVGFAHQLHANLCGDACVAMLNHFYGLPFHSLENNPRGAFEGLNVEKGARFKKEAIKKSYQDIKKLLNKSPLVLDLPLRQLVPGSYLGHLVTLIGVREEEGRVTIIYHDPLTGPNREITFDELVELHKGISDTIEVYHHPSNSTSPSFSKTVTLTKNIIPKKYGEFFSDELGKKPIACFKKLLEDYTNFALFSNRTHKDEVRAFLKKIEGIKDSENITTQKERLTNLISDFNETFPNLNQGELSSRFTVAKQYMNQ